MSDRYRDRAKLEDELKECFLHDIKEDEEGRTLEQAFQDILDEAEGRSTGEVRIKGKDRPYWI